MRWRTRQVRWWRWVLGGLALGVAIGLGCAFYVEWRYRERIVPAEQVPSAPVAIVFGAGLSRGGTPSPVLRQRLDAAVALYRSGKVEMLLLSGDNTDRYHDETASMRRYVVSAGLPESALVGDDAGVSTYDSIVRGRQLFGVNRAILVTQDFHLPRALFIANSVGMDAWGVAADAPASWFRRYGAREILARAMTVPLIWIRPAPRVEGRIPPHG